MQFNRIAAPAGTVSGLGVCDALRLELMPVQLGRLAVRIDALEAALGPAAGPDVAYEQRLVRMLRAGLPAPERAEPFAFVGPAGMIGDLVRGAVRDAVRELSELARGDVARAGLRAAAADAGAWIRTFLDCHAVESFSFDPGEDPGRPW
jgi:hypothetical protein